MSGNFVIGIIVFTILVIVNFVVITKGSGRIAEVAARFNLDAMPGKQMAIDADLSAGLINENDARTRRKHLEDESAFFGAMDGASKFVRGDAIAGLLVVFINVIGGMIIGIAQQGMPFGEAARTYTLLTVGDGLVTQIPALIVSTAAGLLVSKAGVGGGVDKALLRQLSGYPKALGMSAAVMIIMSLLPGIPMLPFLALGGGAGMLAYMIAEAHAGRRCGGSRPGRERCRQDREPAEEPISAALKIDDLKIELGYALLPLVNAPDGSDRLTEQIKALRRSLASRDGLRDAGGAHPRQCAARGQRLHHQAEGGRRRPGPRLAEPAHGDGPGRRAGARSPACTRPSRPSACPPRGSTPRSRKKPRSRATRWSMPRPCWRRTSPKCSRATCRSCSPTRRCRSCSRTCPKEQAELVKDIVPALITVSGIQRVLQLLLAERISIRDLPTILEGIADALAFTRNPTYLVEHVRARLARQICAQHTSPTRLPAADRALAQMGAGLRRVDRRPGRGQEPRHAALASSPSSSRSSASASRMRRARAKRRCWSPHPACGRSCARSSSASAPRRACCRSRKSIRARG